MAGVENHKPVCPIKLYYAENDESTSLESPPCKTCSIDLAYVDQWDDHLRFSELFRRYHGKSAIDIAQDLGWTVSESKGYWTICTFGN